MVETSGMIFNQSKDNRKVCVSLWERWCVRQMREKQLKRQLKNTGQRYKMQEESLTKQTAKESIETEVKIERRL